MKVTRYLVVSSDGEARTTKQRPRPQFGQVAYRLNITVPDGWKQVVGDIDVEMPEPPPASLTIEGDVLG